MPEITEKELLSAIQSDDVAAFNALMEKAECGFYRLGRFPVLSLLYLFSSKKILAAYEKEFIPVSSWKDLRVEPASAVDKFSKAAGKCLRLYYDAVVMPIEMLLILDKTSKVKKLYPLFAPTEEIKSRLKKAYYVKYSLGIEFDGDKINIDRRPLRRAEKKLIAIIASASAAFVAVSVVTPVSVVSYLNKYGIAVSTVEQIDFTKSRTYALKNDIVIPARYSVKSTSCNFIGGGHKIVLEKGASLGEFGGKMSNLTIETNGTPIFTSCSGSTVLKDITVNVTADAEFSDHSAFVTVYNYGTLDGVTVNAEGSAYASGEGADGTSETVFGGIAAFNAYSSDSAYGKIKNCTVNYTSFSLSGEIAVNATFGGIAGVNNGLIEDSSVEGDISADTFDLAGACYINNSVLSGIVSSANLSQVSDDKDWSPIVAGVVSQNVGTVERSKSTGNLSVTGADFAICGGIAGQSYGRTEYCYSSGDISVTAKYAYAGGIYGMSQAAWNGFYVYFGIADYCLSESNISATLGEGNSCVGGIGGLIQQLSLYGAYYGGGVTNSIFTGGISGEFNYYGNIVGVCGANVYESNSYVNGDGVESYNFDGNYFVENSVPSFGAKATTDEIFLRVDGKGATSAPLTEIIQTDLYKQIKEKLGL